MFYEKNQKKQNLMKENSTLFSEETFGLFNSKIRKNKKKENPFKIKYS